MKLKHRQCYFCSKHYERNGHLEDHIRKHITETPWHCSICKYKYFYSEHLYQSHMLQHTSTPSIPCKLCKNGKLYRTKSDLKDHIKNIHLERKLACTFCSKRFASNSDFKRHIQTHLNETPFSCYFCKNLRFKYRSKLSNHLLKFHLFEKPVKCSRCPHRSYSSAALNSHMQNVHGIAKETAKCPICSKMMLKTTVRNHIRYIHHQLKVMRFACYFCNAPVLCLSALEQHLRNHTMERHLKCELCDYRSRSAFVMNHHTRKTHLPGDHRCYLCPMKTFFTAHSLAMHHRSEHVVKNGTIIVCYFCGQNFSSNRDHGLYQHIRKNHTLERV